MNKEQRLILEPYAKLISEMEARIEASSDDEIEVLLEACNAADETNCWHRIYDAAKLIKPMILRERFARHSKSG